MKEKFLKDIIAALQVESCIGVQDATATQLYRAISRAALKRVYPLWNSDRNGKQAAYLSAEFLIGRMTFSNLLNMGLLDETIALLSEKGADVRMLENLRDPALGNGGLGRLAACFLDAAATKGIRLNGYGIRYRYGLFRQNIQNGFQVEQADNWTACGDPWSMRREEEKIKIEMGDGAVFAVPYDMPIIGYGGHTVNTLRLWQAEAVVPFDFTVFDSGKYVAAFAEKTAADTLTAVLYPNDSTQEGKKLRLKQQYFFAAASVQDMVRAFKRGGGVDLTCFAEKYTLQLNDTHPVVAIPELIRLLTLEGIPFETALEIAREVFAYTNHTIMPEALEKWDVRLFRRLLPQVYPVVQQLQKALRKELRQKGVTDFEPFDIVIGGQVHMARMALFAAHAVNGVATIHTDLLKTRVLSHWYGVYPERFYSITNGITPRRWLVLANPELAALITARIGEEWLVDLDRLQALRAYAEDVTFLEQMRFMRQKKKKQLAAYVEKQHGLTLRWDFMLDVQAKRLHEYKRQLMNALSILDICFSLQNGELPSFHPTAFVFAAKAAPGYYRAKAIIKLINAVAAYVEKDPQLQRKVQVMFIPDYSVSLAEKLIPAADISEQISTAGTEASGTGNMKFMLNGVPTLGTYDGANIEIVERAGRENNYIFGATVEALDGISATYDPKALLVTNARLKRVTDALIDGTLEDDGSGMFADLYRSLTEGKDADRYYVLGDFEAYRAARLQANGDYGNGDAFAKKGLLNIAAAGYFSADRAIEEYTEKIWHI